MRVLIVNSHGGEEWRGGVERGIALLTRQLVERGLDVSFLQSVADENPTEVDRTALHGRNDPSRRRFRRVHNRIIDFAAPPASALERVIRRHAPDVVHTHNLPGISTGIWEICRSHGIPVFHSLHDYYLLCPRMSLMRRSGEPCHPSPVWCGLRAQRLARWAPGVRVVSGVSQSVLDAHADIFPYARREVLRNPMAAPSEEYPPPAADPLTIGYIGGLSHEKGVDVLLAVAERMRGQSCVFRFAGHGRLVRYVAEKAAQLPNVEYDGVVDAASKRAFFAACDVGIIPSVWAEPGGPTHTLIEWLAAGRPALVSRRGGLGEVVDSYAGVVPIEPTADAMTDAIARLLEPAVWNDLVRSVRRPDNAGEIDRWVERHLEIYESLAGAS